VAFDLPFLSPEIILGGKFESAELTAHSLHTWIIVAETVRREKALDFSG
jgi:hypothetical protein